jgi:hypothetical protein
VVARKGKEDTWSGPEQTFTIDSEVDLLLAKRASDLNDSQPFPLDSNVAEEWAAAVDEVLARPKYANFVDIDWVHSKSLKMLGNNTT